MISYLILKVESYDVEAFVKAARAFDSNGVILVSNYGGEIVVAHAPERLNLRPKYHFFRKGHWTASRWIKWPSFFLVMMSLMLKVCLHDRVRTFYIEGGDVLAWFAQLLKKFGRIERTVFMIADWSPPRPDNDLFERINNWKMRLNDWLMTRMDTTVLVSPKPIFDLRNEYWHGRTKKNSVLFDNSWAWLIESKREVPQAVGRSICFLGNLRRKFGLETLFALLPKLNREHGFRLKVIAPETVLYHEYKELSRQMGVDHLIDWRGFVPLETFPAEFADCFCGLNTQEAEENTGKYVVAGRVVNFLQYFLVPIMSPVSGVMVDFLRQYELGIVCEPTPEQLEKAIIDSHANYAKYASNISNFLEKNPCRRGFGEILSPTK